MTKLDLKLSFIAPILVVLTFNGVVGFGQSPEAEKVKPAKPPRNVRVITVPVTSRNRGKQKPEEGQNVDLVVREDGEEQKILSIRDIGGTAMSLAVLIQDDVVPSVATDIKAIGIFIKQLPRGSRVMVGYIRAGSLEVRQKFTTDLDRAAGALRIPISSSSAAPFNPYVEIREGLKRFESLPSGRMAMLVVSDGLDTRSGLDSSSPGLSLDLERAITEAQRRGVAIYSIFVPTVTTAALRNSLYSSNGQGSLAKMAEETGGRVYSQGLSAPVSFNPFLDEVSESLSRQFAITFLSTHPRKGFHKIEITSSRSDVGLEYPRGYSY
jgi:VWFA-related protein